MDAPELLNYYPMERLMETTKQDFYGHFKRGISARNSFKGCVVGSHKGSEIYKTE